MKIRPIVCFHDTHCKALHGIGMNRAWHK